MTSWINETDHTFSTGRTFRIREHLSLQWLVLRAVEDDDPQLASLLEDWFTTGGVGDGKNPQEMATGERAAYMQTVVRLNRTIIEAMFVHPRVVWDADEMPSFPPPADGEAPAYLWAGDLHDAEQVEALEIALKGVADAARFRGDDGGVERRPRRKSVGKQPKPGARAASGKR